MAFFLSVRAKLLLTVCVRSPCSSTILLTQDNKILTSGGRVLCVTALGKNTTEAHKNAYNCVENIFWKDCFYRTDIGYRAIRREK